MQLRLANLDDAPAISRTLQRRSSDPAIIVEDWTELNRELYSALWLEKVGLSLTIGLIVMVAALNIVASLVLLVMEKSRDIAILRTMGAPAGAIRRIFVYQGLTIGLIGTVAGAVLGLGREPHRRPLSADPAAGGRVPDHAPAVPRPAARRHGRRRVGHPHLSARRPSIRRGRPGGSIPPKRCGISSRMPLVEIRGLVKSYRTATGALEVLHDLDLTVEPGEMVAVVGASGVGKSTLLHVLGGLDHFDAGTIRIGDAAIDQMDDAARVAVPEPARRVRLSVPPSAAGIHGARKRRDAVAHCRASAPASARIARPRAAQPRRVDGSGRPSPRRAVGRRAAARCGCARAGRSSIAAPRRRADRESRRSHGRRSPSTPSRHASRARADVGHRHPQFRTCKIV